MWCEQFNRSDFADLLGRSEQRISPSLPLAAQYPLSPPHRDSLWAVWPNGSETSSALPVLLIVDDGSLTDFLAWTTTFFAGFRPFTSFFRVLPWSLFEASREIGITPSLGEMEGVCIGAILGEALTEARTRAVFDTLSIQGFASTYSHAMTRALALRHINSVLDSIGECWGTARELTGQSERTLPLEQLADIWCVIRSLQRNSAPFSMRHELEIISNAIQQLRLRGELESQTWEALSDSKADYFALRREMSDRKERRVELFEKITAELSTNTGNVVAHGFVCGHLASLISEGTLSHADLLFPLLEKIPNAVLWYGICAGLSPSTKLQSDKGGLGRRLLRDLLRADSLLERPQADISIDELEVFFNSDNSPARFVQQGSSSLSVELVPAVTLPLRWPLKRTVTAAPSGFAELDMDVTVATLGQLGSSLEKARKLYDALSSQLQKEQPKEPQQTARKPKRNRRYYGGRG